MSSAATSFARTAGWRKSLNSVVVVNLIVLVTCAAAAIESNGESWTLGGGRWSGKASVSKPRSSARRGKARNSGPVLPRPGVANRDGGLIMGFAAPLAVIGGAHGLGQLQNRGLTVRARGY